MFHELFIETRMLKIQDSHLWDPFEESGQYHHYHSHLVMSAPQWNFMNRRTTHLISQFINCSTACWVWQQRHYTCHVIMMVVDVLVRKPSTTTILNLLWLWCYIKYKMQHTYQITAINSLWPSGTIWQHRSGTTLAQVIMVCFQRVPKHYLNQSRLINHQWGPEAFTYRAISQEILKISILDISSKITNFRLQTSGLILGFHPANERRCYFVTTSLTGWA